MVRSDVLTMILNEQLYFVRAGDPALCFRSLDPLTGMTTPYLTGATINMGIVMPFGYPATFAFNTDKQTLNR